MPASCTNVLSAPLNVRWIRLIRAASSGAESAADPVVSDVTAAGASPGGPLPYRNQMESLFGRSLPDVEVQTGMAAKLAPFGAEALTIGSSVA